MTSRWQMHSLLKYSIYISGVVSCTFHPAFENGSISLAIFLAHNCWRIISKVFEVFGFLTACISLFSLFTVWKPLNVRCLYYFFWPKSSDVLLYFGLIYDKTQCPPPQKLIFGLNWSCIFTVWSCMCFPCSQCSVSSDDVIFLWIKTRTIVYKKRLLLNETVIQS